VNFFNPDGPLFRFITKIGEIILVTLLWILCCIPIITFVPSTVSFYYAMVKSVRKERGYPAREFFRSMKRTVGPGMICSFVLVAWLMICWYGRLYQLALENGLMVWVYEALMILTVLMLSFFFPVMSRFDRKLPGILKLTFLMTVRYFYIALWVLVGTVLTFWLLTEVLPIACVLFLPGLWCYAATFPVEYVLRKYTPEPPEGEDAWYAEEPEKPKRISKK
jgi:uncharacterized membrane protein YesL